MLIINILLALACSIPLNMPLTPVSNMLGACTHKGPSLIAIVVLLPACGMPTPALRCQQDAGLARLQRSIALLATHRSQLLSATTLVLRGLVGV